MVLLCAMSGTQDLASFNKLPLLVVKNFFLPPICKMKQYSCVLNSSFVTVALLEPCRNTSVGYSLHRISNTTEQSLMQSTP